MLLKSLRLKNIRSYQDQKIEFPPGIALLAGDIGAGKSTILLAIEFALFGLLRGDLSGTALLRNGASQGMVELAFELHNKTYTIGRTLKRTKNSVEQDAGYIIQDGTRTHATAIELKTKVLSLLGYPADLLTKSKTLIYRYTVYTPQEEMKRIILEDAEQRLTILRKVFDIDKYKRIKDNIEAYARLLRERKRAFEGQLVDEPIKKQQFQEQQKKAEIIQQSLLDIQPRLNSARQKVLECRKQTEELEKQRLTLLEQQAVLKSAEAEISSLIIQQKDAEQEISRIAGITPVETPAVVPETIAQQLQQKQQQLKQNDDLLRTHISSHAELKAMQNTRQKTARQILSMNECPTCKQPVTQEHKHRIAGQENEHAQKLTAQLLERAKTVNEQEERKKMLMQEINSLQQQHSLALEAKIRFQQAELQKQRKTQLESQLLRIREQQKNTLQRKTQAFQHIQQNNSLEQQFQQNKKILDEALKQEQSVIVEHAKLLEQAKHAKETITLLEQELVSKQNARTQLEKITSLNHWIAEEFSSLMSIMEKHVFTKVYHDFNSLFQQWFSLLVDDEVLNARLDDTFSPVVQQNGYDIEVTNLSGGEKTACALAYRLALNKVITALRAGIHTGSLIILDEPTDGFSADQLAKMRDVLEQVNAKQIILVSHESAIESIADRVLRVVKEEHASRILV
jgi:exonuclease SbcC